MFWGLSSALDLYDEYLKAFKLKPLDEVNAETKAESEEQESNGEKEKETDEDTPEATAETEAEILETKPNEKATEAKTEVADKVITLHPNGEVTEAATKPEKVETKPVEVTPETKSKSNEKLEAAKAEEEALVVQTENQLKIEAANQDAEKLEAKAESENETKEAKTAANAELETANPEEETPDAKAAPNPELEETDADDNHASIPDELNIFVCGNGDPRHIIKTLAKRYTHSSKPKLNIYMLEGCMEIEARNMLLMSIALESASSFNLVNKAHLFMDLYGNTLMRPSSHHYMAAKARTLLKMITDEQELQRLAPMLNLDALKYKERDGLEMAFNFWQPKPIHIYNIQDYWNRRVRALLGNRYDFRHGAFDWDLSMTLKDREGQQICSQEYRYWRECGIAFVFPEYEHCKPNKTFAAGLVRNGQTYLHRGYVGDIQTGPFCGFGLRTSEERMLHSVHGDNDYRATDVTERNLLEFFHELQTNSAYVHDKSRSRRYGSVQLQMGARLEYDECDAEGQQSFDKPWIKLDDVNLHFISPEEVQKLKQDAGRWKNFFDIICVGQNFFSFLSKEFLGALRTQGLFVLETKLLTVERKEQVSAYEEKAKDLLRSAGLKPVINYQAINSNNMVLKYKKNPLDEPPKLHA